MKVNGTPVTPPDGQARLLDYLRDDLGLTGAKEGCGMGECGSCTVLLDGVPVCSCLVLVCQAEDAEVTTVEGLPPSPVQDAFVDGQAVQCGFCIAGMVVSACALLDRHPDPTDDQIHAALEGNLCRCTGYSSILRAVRTASQPTHPNPATQPTTPQGPARHADTHQAAGGQARARQEAARQGPGGSRAAGSGVAGSGAAEWEEA
ncbi:(2Fe-2S)-binding protein [Nonomuraea sp. NPDC050536]|uniref:(2Fe-2S)-binding protein n=1 Tax=Nonomuraea sp. NPDC050536 TaxID=3364366 RepID=UPI0037CC15D9